MVNQWIRLWLDMPTDPKWRTIARVSGASISEVVAVYVNLMVSAGNAEKRGVTQCNAEDVASLLDVTTETVEAILKAMQGRVLDGEKLSGWDKRQPLRNDDSNSRVKAFRERKKAEKTECNDVKRDVTRCNAPEKIREEIKEKELPIGNSKKKFSRPTVQEVSAYVAEINAGIDPQKFIDHYDSKGWVVGKSPMKDWKAAVRTWRSENKTHKPRPNDDQAWIYEMGCVNL